MSLRSVDYKNSGNNNNYQKNEMPPNDQNALIITKIPTMNKSRSWERDEKHKAEDTVHGAEEIRCIKRENNGSQCGLSAGRGRERRCRDSLGVRTPPPRLTWSTEASRGGGRKGGPPGGGKETVTFPGEGVMAFGGQDTDCFDGAEGF